MIIDTIKNCGLYAAGNENLKKGFEFIKEFLENPKAVGKYEIDGDNIYAIVQEYETKAPGKFESHKKYTDIQFLVSGKELTIVIASIQASNAVFEQTKKEQIWTVPETQEKYIVKSPIISESGKL